MAEIDLDTSLKRAEGFQTAAVQDDLMMLNVSQGAYYSLDSIAAEIWKMLEQPSTARELAGRLQPRYAVTVEQCQQDVLAFLEDMRANGMILVA
jgi:hypothetical protein